ncbi:MAG: hypothetical protein MUD01_14035 [Chloroflexaceae bacterium]|jgi:hypothetical protein|nr:hypothetical protein [Chloroflexaceae bacterium]
MWLETDRAFAPVDRDDNLDRIAGGNETEVYRTDDARFVVKLKHELGCSMPEALRQARQMRVAAERYAECLGPRHSIPSYYLLSRDSEDKVQVLVVQPFLRNARALFDVDYKNLSKAERHEIASELRHIIKRSLRYFWRSGSMPDLYGRTASSKSDRTKNKSIWQLPRRLWSFLVRRNLLQAHNLMLTDDPQQRVVLIDYDFVRRGPLYRLTYFGVRLLLFLRDHAVILAMEKSGNVPGR